ncbi:MAG TPA: hypothetical protein EYQ31_17685 [Candidatus Handelsmanbacteria bacterium]|nr:hypothetical protein [Candidatus Handelsmanbacteria bacterium]
MAPKASAPQTGKRSDITLRAVVLGTVLAAAINVACPYSVLVLHNAGLTSDYITAGAMMLFLLLVGLLFAQRWRTSYAMLATEVSALTSP